MEASKQGGFGVIGIMVALGIAIVGIGAYASLSTPTDSMSGSDEFVADPTKSGIENMAQNIAENATDEMMDVVEGRDAMVVAEMDADMEVEAAMMDDGMAATDETLPTPPATPTVAGTFTDYSADKLALAENGQVVLFFHADWCPSCRGLENDVNANLGDIPENTHILKLDYDTETELKKKYGVVRQHTLILVDSNGNEIKKLTGLTNTLDQVVNQL